MEDEKGGCFILLLLQNYPLKILARWLIFRYIQKQFIGK